MKNWIAATICCLAITTVGSTAVAQTPAQVSQFSEAGKRAWLRDRILSEIVDPFQRSSMLSSLSTMTPFQLDRAISNYFANLYANQARNYYGTGPVIGYQPVITTLPTGTSLNVGGVISPDRRHVRINAQPFFSNVGQVRTFNPVTGQSGIYNGNNGPFVQQRDTFRDRQRTFTPAPGNPRVQPTTPATTQPAAPARKMRAVTPQKLPSKFTRRLP